MRAVGVPFDSVGAVVAEPSCLPQCGQLDWSIATGNEHAGQRWGASTVLTRPGADKTIIARFERHGFAKQLREASDRNTGSDRVIDSGLGLLFLVLPLSPGAHGLVFVDPPVRRGSGTRGVQVASRVYLIAASQRVKIVR